MKQHRDFHRLVRVVYRACRRLYGKEKTQDECLKVFKVVFPELYRLRNSADEYADVSFSVQESLLLITHEWNPKGALSGVVSHAIGQLQISNIDTSEAGIECKQYNCKISLWRVCYARMNFTYYCDKILLGIW